MNFEPNFIEQLKNRINIVELISQYCQLEKKGSSYWACCPLPGHREKTPSFCVNEDGQFYKCFGCGKGGDAIKFVMEMESLDFLSAVKFLAEKAGIPLPSYSKADEDRLRANETRRARMLALMKAAAKFYVQNLYSEDGAPFREYLEKRGIFRETAVKFGLGASLDFFGLPDALAKKGYTNEEMLEAGVATRTKSGSGIVDFEAKRVIVPIIDPMGSVIAFGGRVIEKSDFAKYKNTAETSLFVKNRVLYNANTLKRLRRGGMLDSVIIVEGYMDVITLAAAGIENAVANMGTALTPRQIQSLKNYSDTVILCYDGDFAGQKANARGIELLRGSGLNVKVVDIPDDMDPDDYVRAHGPAAMKELIASATTPADYLLTRLMKSVDINSSEGRRQYVMKALRVVAGLETEFDREDALKRISSETRVSFEALRRDLEKSATQKPNVERIETPNVAKEEKKLTMAERKRAAAERFIICAMLYGKPYATGEELEELAVSDETRQKLFEYCLQKMSAGEEIFPSAAVEIVGEEGLGESQKVLTAGEMVFGTDTEKKYYSDCVATVKICDAEEMLKQLNAKFDSETDPDERSVCARLIAKKTAEIDKLKRMMTKDSV